MPTTDGTWRVVEVRDITWHRPIGYGLLASAVLLLVVAVFLLARRLGGALAVPLPLPLLVTTAIGLLAWAWSVRAGWSELVSPQSIVSPKSDRLMLVWLPSAIIVLFAVACSYPGSRLIDWLVWVPIIAAASVPWLARHPARRSSPAFKRASPQDQCLQQLTRSRNADGREAVQGTLLAEFAVSERTADLFVGFCPPFERMPNVGAEIDDGTDATVKLVQVLHNGAQLEIRLAHPAATPTAVPIQFFAAESESN